MELCTGLKDCSFQPRKKNENENENGLAAKEWIMAFGR